MFNRKSLLLFDCLRLHFNIAIGSMRSHCQAHFIMHHRQTCGWEWFINWYCQRELFNKLIPNITQSYQLLCRDKVLKNNEWNYVARKAWRETDRWHKSRPESIFYLHATVGKAWWVNHFLTGAIQYIHSISQTVIWFICIALTHNTKCFTPWNNPPPIHTYNKLLYK